MLLREQSLLQQKNFKKSKKASFLSLSNLPAKSNELLISISIFILLLFAFVDAVGH